MAVAAVTIAISTPVSASSVTPAATGGVQGYIMPAQGRVLWNGTPIFVGANGYFSMQGVAGVTYNLTGNASGYYNKTVFVTLSAGVTLWENLTLRIGNATLRFFVQPYDSSVVLSGVVIVLDSVGQAQIGRFPGTYNLAVSHTLYATFREQLNLTPFEVLPLAITLTSFTNKTKNGSGGNGINNPFLSSGAAEVALFGGATAIGSLAVFLIVQSHRRRGVPLIGNWPAPTRQRRGNERAHRRRIARRDPRGRLTRDSRGKEH